MTEEIDWAPLGEDWWREAGANCHATEQQIIFALHRHKGMTATGAAKAASYAGDDATIRQAGHRAAHSTAVMGLLSMAKAETGQGPDGNVTMDEAKQILSRLARGSDPNVRIKAIDRANRTGVGGATAGKRNKPSRRNQRDCQDQYPCCNCSL
jgi:hypothetical protein